MVYLCADVRKAKAMGKHIVVAGCVPQGEQKHPELAGLSMLGVQQIDRVVEVVEETLKVGVLRWKSVSPFLMLCGTGEYDKNSWPEKDGIGTEGWWSEIGAAEDTQKRPG